MRERGTASVAPNFEKSTFGHGNRLRPVPPPAAAPAATGADAPDMTCLTKLCTSSCRMRFFGPVPVTRVTSTPSSRANLRTEGDACGRSPGDIGADGNAAVGAGGAASTGAGALTTATVAAAAGARADAGAGAGAVADAGAAATFGTAAPSALSSINAISTPVLTVSPILILISLITPANGAGISIVALSDSTVINESSALTVSPALTRISITGTSLKSPISGTNTSLIAMLISLFS